MSFKTGNSSLNNYGLIISPFNYPEIESQISVLFLLSPLDSV